MTENAAIELLKQAVQLDQNEKYFDAFSCYSQGIQMLLKAVKEIPLSEERKRNAFQQRLIEYMDRAEKVKQLIEQEKVKTKHEQIQIKDGSTGNSYEKIFSRFLDKNVTEIKVEDPYIRAHHQIVNFLRFCEVVVKSGAPVKKIDLTTSSDPNEATRRTQLEQLSQFKEHLAKKHSIELNIEFKNELHDREIRFNNGWIIKIGRGLDFYKAPETKFSIGYFDLELRPCHQTTIDIFHSNRVHSSS